MRDGEQPRRERALLAVPLKSLERLREDSRGEVLGIRLPIDPAVDVAVDAFDVAPVKGSEAL